MQRKVESDEVYQDIPSGDALPFEPDQEGFTAENFDVEIKGSAALLDYKGDKVKPKAITYLPYREETGRKPQRPDRGRRRRREKRRWFTTCHHHVC